MLTSVLYANRVVSVVGDVKRGVIFGLIVCVYGCDFIIVFVKCVFFGFFFGVL